MTTPSLPTIELLADLAAHGINVKSLGDGIGFKPRSAITPALLQRLQAHKAELLHFLDTACFPIGVE